MVVCFVALPVLIILGLFSVRYRKLAWEAFDCVFRMATFRKCHSQFDQKVKATLVGKLMSKSPRAAGFLHKRFTILSWIFVVLFLVSIVGSGYGLYNYYLYGNCNGPDTTAFCIFDPFHEAKEQVSTCGTTGEVKGELIAPTYLSGLPTIGKSNIKVIMFGCFTCPYTQQATGIIKKIIKDYGKEVEFIFIAFPLDQHEMAYEASLASECVYSLDKIKYWQFVISVLEHEHEMTPQDLTQHASDLGLDIEECLDNQELKSEVERKIQLGREAGIYGTPTFFVDGEAIVGPKEKEVLAAIEEALE